jgi:hypothetical protein
MPRTRGGEWPDGDIKPVREQNVDVLVSLLTEDEVSELCSTRQTCADRRESEYLTFPVLDRGLPNTDAQTARFILSVASKALAGR